MEHELFFDGTTKKYTWSIKTGNVIVDQARVHPPAYLSGGKLDISNTEESKFIALHVGIYWGLGVFIIKNFDTINVMCDSEKIYEILCHNNKTDNQIINDKIYFTNQLVHQRNLKVNYQMIESSKNLASKYLSVKDDTSTSKNSRGFI